MNRLLAVVPVVLLAAACGTSGGSKAATSTVTATTTVTATNTSGSSPSDTSAQSSSEPTGASPDACSLLTQTEAEAVAGTPLMKPVGAGANASGAFVECQFTGPTTGPTAQVEVYVGDGAKQQLHIERDNLKHTFTTVPGVGDQCLQEDGYIFVEKNGLWASIHLVRLNDPQQNVVPLQTGIKALTARLP